MKNDFEGKVALVTGSASGLGRATALLFAEKGAKVVVSDVAEEGGLETVRLITSSGGHASFISCDVSNEHEVIQLISHTLETYGQLDFGVNNAGIGGLMTPTHLYPSAEFEKVMSINTNGVFLCMREELQVMLEQGFGSIVNVSSVAGLAGFPNNLAYSASKHAVIGMTKTAGLEYARKGIRVNAVCPVFTITPMVTEMFEIIGDQKDKLQASIPMKRFGQPEEIAETIVWLCSDAASFVTAHAMPIDGGFMAG
ncbi:NAD(P)-dependent dehydrogenase, short-chain alcohol dehydrogenase family [Pseudarcicella hirudinis]|uniref:NAD(P)-dependent dehydrogenase, short-chain alcohol dehydrogenase family n=1 Tax=Pseudarcicella hirudinis TaxID=1079859 RepID=A0A1I5XB59_9BACT|nr:glucose 1-dehydrogenase [Pseudarcicella hirudinis]SFQ29161.1 NAD(P)-dependent dehydrogenase, short-chain alcohol dehydrogenase family [Pseudarcicella hirudinis]